MTICGWVAGIESLTPLRYLMPHNPASSFLHQGRLNRQTKEHKSRLPLCIFGGLAVLVIYGGLMNPSTVLTFYENPTWPMFLTAYIMGFPFDLIHAAATVIFLWFVSRPMLEELDRVKVKYGLVQ